MFWKLAMFAGGLFFLSAAPLSAQDPVLDQLYGEGVHAYFSNDFVAAHKHLTDAIDSHTLDPRAYYFRGLAYLELHREDEARMDFQKGGDLETADTNQFYDCSKALVRVQGKARLALEQFRVKSRMEGLRRSEALRKARYEALRSQEDRVIRAGVETTPTEPAIAAVPAASKPAEAKPAETKAADPFAPAAAPAPAEKKTETAAPKAPAAKPEPANDDPFGEKEPASKPAEAKPAEAKPAEAPAPAEKEADAAAPKAAAPAPAATPAAAKADEPKKPAEPKPAAAPPAAKPANTKDPFAQ
jgi:hypothetical protein